MTGQKLDFPDCGTCDWPIEIIKTIELMQKVLENRCQSCKKVTIFWKNIRPGQFHPYIHLPNSKINQTLVSDENLMYKKFYTDKPRVCKLLKLIRVSASERESLKFLWIYFLIYISGLYCVVLCLRQTNDSLASDQRRVRWSDPDGPRLAAQGLSTHISSHQQ